MTAVLAESQTTRHRLSEINVEERTGVCSKCGPVSLHKTAPYKGVQRWRCATRSTRSALAYYHSPTGNHAHRNARFLREYGITVEQYDAMVEQQGGTCARCKTPPTTMKLAVDHCHATGAVRALLCGPCNTYIGRLEANMPMLASDLAYLS